MTRLVIAVALAMTAVLVASGAFVFWRVEFALNRQLDQDLRAYQRVVETSLAGGATPPSATPGQSYQTYDRDGTVTGGDAPGRLVDRATVRRAAAGEAQRQDVGHLFPAVDHPFRVLTRRLTTPEGTIVVASAISKLKHDEALRELLLQLALAGLATLVAASYVGYRTARGALNPVERYRRAAEEATPGRLPVLPVPPHRDDEVTRLGHTFNALLAAVGDATERERQFLADASHELRSPLTVMKTELQWMRLRPRSTEETTASLDSLALQVERLIDLSDALLDLEEVRAATEPPTGLVDAQALVGDVVATYRSQAAAAGRTLATRVPTDAVVLGDDRWLSLALGNLVSNALKHGEGTVTIAVTNAAGRTRLSVGDEGPGFSDTFAERAFDRFTRADDSRATPGTGLGLALVLAVAEAHHGSARVDGATVTLDLPGSP